MAGGLTDHREAADNPDRKKKKKNKYARRLKGVLIEAFVMFEKVRSPGEGGGREGGREAAGLFIFSDVCEEWHFLTFPF